MSIVRTGNHPGAWRDEGPQTHVSLHYRVGGALVSAQGFGPSLAIRTQRELERSKRRSEAYHARREAELAPKPRPVCGAIMPTIGEPCARTPGHACDSARSGGHRSAAVATAGHQRLSRLARSRRHAPSVSVVKPISERLCPEQLAAFG